MKSIENNLFFLTGVGQLRNISGFIKEYNATNNVAVILYTQQNLNVVNHIKENMDESLFLEIQYVKLPVKLLEEKKSKSKIIYQTLEKTINHNIEKYHIKNVFLCSSSNYYSFIEQITKNKTSLNLLEEGLTTYRVYQENNDERQKKYTLGDVFSVIKKVLKRLYIIFKPVIKLIKSIIELVVVIISFITRINFIYYIKKFLNKSKKYKYGLITEFDNAYVCYPELLQKLNPKNKNVEKLQLNFENENVIFTNKQDKENILFINQKYGLRYKEHFDIIFSIFRDMGIKKIYMKFHPKEDFDDFRDIYEESKSLYPDLQIITLENCEHIPVENLINRNNITKIVALTSSSLFYSKLVKEDIDVISIAEEYKKRWEDIALTAKEMQTFLHDYEMLDKLFNVEQYVYEDNKSEEVK